MNNLQTTYNNLKPAISQAKAALSKVCSNALVNTTNNVPTIENKYFSKSKHEPKKDNSEFRKLLFDMRDCAGEILPEHRVCKCGKSILPIFSNVEVVKGEGENSHYQNLVQCGSVWICPFCSHKISSKRAEEVKHVLKGVANEKSNSVMFALTMPHYSFQKYKLLQTTISETWRFVVHVRKFKRLAEKYNLIGFVRSCEVTQSFDSNKKANFHPHLHIILSAKCNQSDLIDFANEIYKIWKDRIKSKGFGDCADFLFKPEIVYNEGEQASEYVSKWGATQELLFADKKEGKRDSRNMFEVLRDLTHNSKMLKALEKIINKTESIKEVVKGTIYETAYFEYQRDKKIFIEFAEGSKGVRQLTWSKDFKKRYGLIEETDQEIAAAKHEAEKQFSITRKLWAYITLAKIHGDLIITYDKNNNINEVVDLINSKLKSVKCKFVDNTLVAIKQN